MTRHPTPFDGVDFENATDRYIAAFPNSSLAEVLQRAQLAVVVLTAMGRPREAEALWRTATIIRRRLLN